MPEPDPPGVRVVLDARGLQDPERAPTTAAYLGALLDAYDARPLGGESFTLLLQSDLADPTERYRSLPVASRRALPPTRWLGAGALTVDPFLLRSASFGAAWHAAESGAAGAVYHATGGSVPLVPGLPVVVTLLDLAPWEFPVAYQRGVRARFGQRLRGRLLRDAAAVIVGTMAVARDVRRLLRVPRARIRVVGLAPRDAFRRPVAEADIRAERERLGLGARYFVYPGRYDARQDLATLLGALSDLARAGRPATLPDADDWPPRVLLVDASPDDRAALARAAARVGVPDALAYAPRLAPERLAALVAGARAAVLPAVSEAAGLTAIEAIAAGVPVVASAVGALPELVGSAGILVEPRDRRRLAAALTAAWTDERVHAALVARTREAAVPRRTWSDVARETRLVYADVAAERDRSRGDRPPS